MFSYALASYFMVSFIMLFLIGDIETQSSLILFPVGDLTWCLLFSQPVYPSVSHAWNDMCSNSEEQIQVLTWILNIICPAAERQKRRVSATETSHKCVSDRG